MYQTFPKLWKFHDYIRNHHEKCIQTCLVLMKCFSWNRFVRFDTKKLGKQALFCTLKPMTTWKILSLLHHVPWIETLPITLSYNTISYCMQFTEDVSVHRFRRVHILETILQFCGGYRRNSCILIGCWTGMRRVFHTPEILHRYI